MIMMIIITIVFYTLLIVMTKSEREEKKRYLKVFNSALKEVKQEYLKEKERADKITEYERARVETLKHELIGCDDFDEFDKKMREIDILNDRISWAYSYVDMLHPLNSFRLEYIIRNHEDSKILRNM